MLWSAKMVLVEDDSLAGWNFVIRERSAAVYDGSATHVSGASIRLTGEDPDELLTKLKGEATRLMLGGYRST